MKFRILMLMISVTWIGTTVIVAVAAATAAAAAEEDENAKWVWGDNDNEKKSTTTENRNGRYNVHEYTEDYDNSNYGSPNQFRPQYPGPYGPNSRPIRPGGGTQVLVGPDGPSGIIGRPYRPGSGGVGGGPILPGVNVDPILSGNLPTWIRNDPRYQEFDSCKCSRGLNCPGLKFGSCARGKQYCCFNSRKYGNNRPGYNQQFNGNYPNRPYQGGVPFRPFNSIPPEYYGNGDYDGGDYYGEYNNGGGYDRPFNNYNNNNNNNRPYYGNGGYDRPYQGPYAPEYQGGGNGFDYNSNYQNSFNWQNPYNRPGRPNYNYDYYGRSSLSAANKNKHSNSVNDNRSGNDFSTTKPSDDNNDDTKNS